MEQTTETTAEKSAKQSAFESLDITRQEVLELIGSFIDAMCNTKALDNKCSFEISQSVYENSRTLRISLSRGKADAF